MLACVCHSVSEKEVRAVIASGARTEEAVGDACAAGTECGTCLDRICDLIDECPVLALLGQG
ncbi:hypothetical protein Afil01_38130 [Actinorhabdospora filicis]|uniref:Bacterioferritin-associated ferredoxin n=1 Tax=Actinorhabdospora filicis TaxID=1785913 RepID=A0A9W6SN76_9ACTN|nr:(2Fe-2S)-binding protein [Actinorhabdospora filicis]GLZ79006.1 hypothetical protein Afil01_38130 [Actinorhabdospora filicis]